MDKRFQVGISGSYGGLNLGDEAILQSITAELRSSLPVEITVFSRNPEDTLRRHQVERAVAVRELGRNEIVPELERLDLFILGGGGILFDGESKIWLREVELANELGVPVMVYSVGAGPLRDPNEQKLVRSALARAAAVTVRERSARQVLEEAGLHREILITADPALLLKPQPLPSDASAREGLDGSRHLVGMSVREPGGAMPDLSPELYHSMLANVADYMVDRFDAHVVFVPMEPYTLDVQHSHAVVSQMLRAQRATVLKGEFTSAQLLSLMKHFRFAVGMRLHFLIFAALMGVPFVALPYASKVSGFLEVLRIQMPPIQLVNAGRLIAYIDYSWDHRRAIQSRIRKALPGLQKRARMSNEIAVQLLTSGSRASAARG